MKVLKFGGSSVANSQNITKVVQIASNAAIKEKVAIVVSAFGKTTNKLIASANKAANNEANYTNFFKEVKQHHLQVLHQSQFHLPRCFLSLLG